MSWTVAICDQCWVQHFPDREPIRMREADQETCGFCNTPTQSGIYVRRDPREQSNDRQHQDQNTDANKHEAKHEQG